MPSRSEDAKTFQALHQGETILILPNAWDAGSAKIIAEAGAKAIATSSAAVAWGHGFADGHDLPFSKLLTTVEEIARVISIPISVDMEGGYSDDPKQVAEHVAAVIGAGAVGMNLEDGRDPSSLHCRKIEAARAVASRAGVDFFINARTDVYLKRLAEGDAALKESIARGAACKQAGASGLFLPGPVDPRIFEAVAREVALPLNAMARPGLPAAATLQKAGVRRLSAATGMMSVAYARVREQAAAFLANGDSDALAAAAGAPVNYNALFAR